MLFCLFTLFIVCFQDFDNAIRHSIWKLECWKLEVSDVCEAKKQRREKTWDQRLGGKSMRVVRRDEEK